VPYLVLISHGISADAQKIDLSHQKLYVAHPTLLRTAWKKALLEKTPEYRDPKVKTGYPNKFGKLGFDLFTCSHYVQD
jgi:hypothetical protein